MAKNRNKRIVAKVAERVDVDVRAWVLAGAMLLATLLTLFANQGDLLLRNP